MISLLRRLPLLLAAGLVMGAIIALALAHFLWVTAAVIVAWAIVEFLRRRQ